MTATHAPHAAVGAPETAAPATTATPARPARRGRHLPFAAYALLIVAVFGGTIGAGVATGTFQTSGKVTSAGERVAPQGGDVSEIRGWMSLGDVADVYGVPLPELIAAFELPADTAASTALKELESDLFSVTALRDWLEARAGG